MSTSRRFPAIVAAFAIGAVLFAGVGAVKADAANGGVGANTVSVKRG